MVKRRQVVKVVVEVFGPMQITLTQQYRNHYFIFFVKVQTLYLYSKESGMQSKGFFAFLTDLLLLFRLPPDSI